MRRRPVHAVPWFLLAAGTGAALANGCSAAGGNTFTTSSSSGTAQTGSGGHGGATGTGGMSATGGMSGTGGGGVGTFVGSGGNSNSSSSTGLEDVSNPCGSQCGPTELCDPAHLGLDDNCNGQVDENCPCTAGQAHSCFKGDPSYHNNPMYPGCFDGTELCTEQGMWGPCIGGVHAVPPDNCQDGTSAGCHAITSPPSATVDLKPGTGNFSTNAVPGSESYTVTCPMGVSQCPTVMPPESYTPVQSGEYTVTYTKTVAGNPTPQTCTFPLIVGAPGLRVELSWEHSLADEGVDLDLHVHQPNNTQPWGTSPAEEDCTWNNCVFYDFQPPQDPSSPNWFAASPTMPPPSTPPVPVSWWLDPIFNNNTCYNDPRGVGQEWSSYGQGCHNPRLDSDDITCDFSVTDPSNPSFCTPENVNIDFPPVGQWVRVAVHYWSNHGLTYDVHPDIKIFCNGALAADLGPAGYYMPQQTVTFEPADGANTLNGNRFWVVADVAFTSSTCGQTLCQVQPTYSDPTQKTPFFTIDTAAVTTFEPAYPPPP